MLRFSTEKWLKDAMGRELPMSVITEYLNSWATKCDGKTLEECLPYRVNEDWCVEEKRKVFRIQKFVEHELNKGTKFSDIVYSLRPDGWVFMCEGKTKQECVEMGWAIDDDWLVEED